MAGLIALGIVAAFSEGSGLLLLGVVLKRLGLVDGAGTAPIGGFRLEASLSVYLVLVVLTAAALWLRTIVLARLRLETIERLRRKALTALLDMEFPALQRLQTGPTIQLLHGEINRVGHGVELLMHVVAIAVRLPVLLAIAVALSPALTVVTLAVALLAGILSMRFGTALKLNGEAALAASRALAAAMTETLTGRRIVKSLGLEAARIRAIAAGSEAFHRAQLLQQRTVATSQMILTVAVAATAALGLTIAVRVFALSVADALILALTFGRLGQSALRIRDAWRIVVMAVPAERAVQALLRDAEAHREPQEEGDIALPTVAVALDRVSLRHPDGTLALDAVSIAVPIGAITVVGGASGAGKSTLADLLMGFAVPTAGTLLLDGVPLDAPRRRAWRRHIGYVPQDSFLFHESLRDNLAAAKPGASETELWTALDAADAGGIVRGLPDGLDTVVGERGERLSGGERQRIALARALLRDPALLILDEPTSALDGDSEARIVAALHRLAGRRTIVVIAHRPAFAGIADQLVLLDGGRVRSVGGSPASQTAAEHAADLD